MDINILKTTFGECEIVNGKVCINPDNIRDILSFAKENFAYDMLKSVTAIDLGDLIELNYNLYSVVNEESVIISAKVNQEAESIVDIYHSAQAEENEIFDMFGIKFIGNENLKRLYMPENWEGYPLKKDYIADDTRLAWNDNDNNNT